MREKGGRGDKPPGARVRTNKKLHPHIGESGVQPQATLAEVSDFTTVPHILASIRMSYPLHFKFVLTGLKKVLSG